jgi:ATP-dependent Clp protease ATP-binding subunit ClpC
MREEFTETLRYALSRAGEEARALNQEFIGTEHLLLGLLVAENSEVCGALDRQEISAEHVARSIRTNLPKSDESPVVTGKLPLSPKAQRLVTDAIVLAQCSQEPRVSTRFMMQAILASADGLGCRAIRDAGSDIDELKKRLAENPPELEP